MSDAARLTMDPPDAGPGLTVRAAGTTAGSGGAVHRVVGTAGVVPHLPWIHYAPVLVTHNLWWLEEMAGVDATETEKECNVYLATFTGTNVSYPGIVSSLLVVAEGLIILMFLIGNQFNIVHLVGRFICGLGRPNTTHNRTFGKLVDKVGVSLPPIDMVLLVEMVPCIQMKVQVKLMEVDLEGLVAETEELIAAPRGKGSSGAGTSVEVQNLVMVSK